MLRSLLRRLTDAPGGGPARCAGPAIDSPSGDDANQLMVGNQTFPHHAIQSAIPFIGPPPTDETEAGPPPPGSWRPPYQPLHPDRRLSDITASSANSAARSHGSPGSSEPRATGGRASADGREQTMRRMSLTSEAPTTPFDGLAEDEACEAHVQTEPTTARGAAEGAAGGAAAAGAPTPDRVAEPVSQEAHGEAHAAAHGTPVDEGAAVGAAAGAAPAAAPMPERVAEAVEEEAEEEVCPCRRPARPTPSTLHNPRPGPQRCPWQERACRAGLRALVLVNVPVPVLTETRPRQAFDATRQPARTPLHIHSTPASASARVLTSRAPPAPQVGLGDEV